MLARPRALQVTVCFQKSNGYTAAPSHRRTSARVSTTIAFRGGSKDATRPDPTRHPTPESLIIFFFCGGTGSGGGGTGVLGSAAKVPPLRLRRRNPVCVALTVFKSDIFQHRPIICNLTPPPCSTPPILPSPSPTPTPPFDFSRRPVKGNISSSVKHIKHNIGSLAPV